MSCAAPGGPYGMSRLTCQISVSLDGFVAGPSQGPEDPLGAGGMRLHDWLFAGEGPQLRAGVESCGAFIMGRNMFGPGRGTWDESWRGWWGGNPYHQPVFVLTHHERETLPWTRCSVPLRHHGDRVRAREGPSGGR